MEQIVFYPDIKKDDLSNGCISEIGWNEMHHTLEKVFKIKKGERLVGITVTDRGIRGKIFTDFIPNK